MSLSHFSPTMEGSEVSLSTGGRRAEIALRVADVEAQRGTYMHDSTCANRNETGREMPWWPLDRLPAAESRPVLAIVARGWWLAEGGERDIA